MHQDEAWMAWIGHDTSSSGYLTTISLSLGRTSIRQVTQLLTPKRSCTCGQASRQASTARSALVRASAGVRVE